MMTIKMTEMDETVHVLLKLDMSEKMMGLQQELTHEVQCEVMALKS